MSLQLQVLNSSLPITSNQGGLSSPYTRKNPSSRQKGEGLENTFTGRGGATNRAQVLAQKVKKVNAVQRVNEYWYKNGNSGRIARRMEAGREQHSPRRLCSAKSTSN